MITLTVDWNNYRTRFHNRSNAVNLSWWFIDVDCQRRPLQINSQLRQILEHLIGSPLLLGELILFLNDWSFCFARTAQERYECRRWQSDLGNLRSAENMLVPRCAVPNQDQADRYGIITAMKLFVTYSHGDQTGMLRSPIIGFGNQNFWDWLH
jgi:hypothetical protein